MRPMRMGCAYWSEGTALLLAVVLTRPRFSKLIGVLLNYQAEEELLRDVRYLLTG